MLNIIKGWLARLLCKAQRVSFISQQGGVIISCYTAGSDKIRDQVNKI